MLTKYKTIFYPTPPSHLRQNLPFFVYEKQLFDNSII